jgi:antitoxin HicB
MDGGETFFNFPSFPEIVSAIPNTKFGRMTALEVQAHAEDAVLTAFQACIASREELPKSDDPRLVSADGFVRLRPLEAMKLELYRVYRANCASISDFARRTGKQDTAARRLLNLRHPSKVSEIDEALAALGKRLLHSWSTESVEHLLGRKMQEISAS